MYDTFKSGPRKGQPKTLKDRVLRFIIEGLKLERVDSCIAKPKFIGIIPNSFWFVGENGSVRSGRNISTSVSITDRVKVQMEKWEKENGLIPKEDNVESEYHRLADLEDI